MKRNFSESLRRILSRILRPAALGISFIILGIFFIVLPVTALDVVLIAVGVLTFILGALNIVFSIADRSIKPETLPSASGFLLLSFGVCLFVFRSSLSHAIAICACLYLAMLGFLHIISFSRSGTARKRKATIFAVPIFALLLTLAIFLALFPSLSALPTGVLLIIKGAELISRGNRKIKSNTEHTEDIESTDFKDIS